MKCLLPVLLLTLPGCVYYAPEQACPAYKPAFAVTDHLIKAYNARDLTAPGWIADAPNSLVANDWSRSALTNRRVPVCKATSAHMRATLIHYRADGSEIARYDVSYSIQLREGRWVIAGRSHQAI